ncbi:HlyC/CorC family transporter [Oscillospiraceae bacterium NSJ-54]|uniref:HlyC/CorC family transporter n=1 Tax=Zongyangia hominis TaxID=2763677 RepID=A0A926EB80_9FIRM|nr:HlyC/CorC family transporter [Zongyangia hominis]
MLIVVLVALSAFFSSTETAYSSVNMIRMRHYADSGDKRAKTALGIAENFDRALSAILIGNNIVNIASASIGTVIFTALMGPAGVGVSTAVMTVVVLIFGEILPKTLAKDNAEKTALAAAGPLRALMTIFSPLVTVFVWLTKVVRRKDGGKQPSVTEEELKYIIEEIEDEGVLQKQESELLQSALEFDDITVSEICTPRVDMVAVDLGDSVEEIKNVFLSEKYTRVPVYDKTIDSIVGVLHEREFLRAYIEHGDQVDVQSLIQEVLFIPPKKRISTLLRELQRSRSHMAIIADQYGGTFGLITLEDILEELVGEIWDEEDEVERDIEVLGEGRIRVKGDIDVDDVFDYFGLPDPDDSITAVTISGYIMDVAGKVPESGERFSADGFVFHVEQVEEQRILSVVISRRPQEEPPQDS